MEMVKLTIDNKTVEVPKGTTIVKAAKEIGVDIPTLCYLEKHNEIGACRICCVEVEGQEKLIAACNSFAQDGMVIYTNSPKVRTARRVNIELMLSEHDCQCPTCVRSGNCSLQKLANDLNILEVPYEIKLEKNDRDFSFPLFRSSSKCIKCMRCIQICEKVQGLGVWDLLSSGTKSTVAAAQGKVLSKNCSLCGQCITHCPTGALRERDDTDKVRDALLDKDKITVVQIAPAVRTAWAESLGLDESDISVGKMVAAAKALGFSYVFDTNFAADLTIMEEGSELIERITKGGKMPMFTSCCPGWVRFMKSEFPEFTDNLSTAKSPQQMFGAVAKSYFAEKIGVDPKNIFCVSIMPCIAKKHEAAIPNLNDACGDPDVDVVLTTREFARMIKADYINVKELSESPFDSVLGAGTGAAVIFGATGGVMEAALRSAYYLVTGKNPYADAFMEFRGENDRREAQIDIGGTKLSVAVTSGLLSTRKLLEDIKSGRKHYDFVEIMACPGGCAGGGGQPIHDDLELAHERGAELYRLDKCSNLRFSHENPEVQALYNDYLEKPLGHKSHKLLHTDLNGWSL